MILSLGLLIEATVVGLIMMLLGPFIPSLFLLGAIAHLLFELIGANKWYCKNGTACKEEKKEEKIIEGYPAPSGWEM